MPFSSCEFHENQCREGCIFLVYLIDIRTDGQHTTAVWHFDRDRSEPGGTRWRTGGEVKGKLANGVGSQYSHATSERGLSSITQADAHTSAASSRLNWRPHRFKWTLPFRGKTKCDFCACAITFRTSYTKERHDKFSVHHRVHCFVLFLVLNKMVHIVTTVP